MTTRKGAPPRRRPAVTVLGALFVYSRAGAGLLWLVAVFVAWPSITEEFKFEPAAATLTLTIIVVGSGIGVAILFAVGWLIWRGSNLARMLVMCGLTLSIAGSAFGYFGAGEEITLRTSLGLVALDILVLLALSSRKARLWAQARARARAGDSPREETGA